MRSSEDERPCQEAQVYYYDLLCQEEAVVPAAVRRHVATCPACGEEMRRLREALFEAEHPPRAGACQDETIEALARQFQLLDERVTCAEAKPRLPELALASPRIPTPVTVHVDHCPQCAGDLAAIRELHLTAGQLKRLGRLLEAGRIAPSKRGWEARDAADGVVPAIPGSVPDEDAGLACRDITMADLFDDVVPSGAAPSASETTGARQEGILRHVRSCPACREKVRTLRRTIEEIVARGNSETVTVYHAENDAEQAWGDADGGYPYPVSVQVLHGRSEAPVEAHAAPTPGLRGLRRSARPLTTLAALVLVVIVLNSLLRTTGSTASGTNVGDVDKILAKVENIRIVVRGRNAGVIQEFWIARRSNILAEKRKQGGALYDLAHDRKRTLASETGPAVSARLSRFERDKGRQFLANCLRDLMAGVSADTRLRPATDEMDGGVPEGLDVYELPSSSPARNAPMRDYRLMYIDRATGLPQRVEFYLQARGQDRGDPMTTTLFTYPTEPEMDSAIEMLFPAP